MAASESGLGATAGGEAGGRATRFADVGVFGRDDFAFWAAAGAAQAIRASASVGIVLRTTGSPGERLLEMDDSRAVTVPYSADL